MMSETMMSGPTGRLQAICAKAWVAARPASAAREWARAISGGLLSWSAMVPRGGGAAKGSLGLIRLFGGGGRLSAGRGLGGIGAHEEGLALFDGGPGLEGVGAAERGQVG